METLHPLTISKSLTGQPTHLLTSDYRSFLLHCPLNQQVILTYRISQFIFNHFKIATRKNGVFSFQGKKYYCVEDIEGLYPFDDWYAYMWSSKKSFSQFLQPKNIFKLFLVDLFFPIFGAHTEKTFVGDKKYWFISTIYPNSDQRGLVFNPPNLSQLGLDIPSFRSFFGNLQKQEITDALMEFKALFHEKFIVDVKYQISLFSEDRNSYWNEFKKCASVDYQNYVTNLMENYIAQL